MVRFIRALAALACLIIAPSTKTPAQDFVWPNRDEIVACPAGQGMPTFREANCRAIAGPGLNTQQRHIWVKATLAVSPNLLAAKRPLGFFVFGKAASRVFLNGELIGENGRPGSDANTEIPGLMDSVFYLDRNRLVPGDNQLVLELSGHHSLIDLINPVHLLAVAPYADPREHILRGYINTLLPLGILVAGTLYFGALALRRREGLTSILVPLIAFFATCQLLAEVSRGLIAYAYPFHDIRLVLILGFAAACGICLQLHIVDRLVIVRKTAVIAASLLVLLAMIWLVPGFDGKTVAALMVPAVVGAIIAGRKTIGGDKRALAYFIALIAFALLTIAIPGSFLDTYFYYVVSGLLLFLFIVEIQKVSEEKRLRAEERARADRLQLALDESREMARPSQLSVSSQGKTEIISSDRISVCRGARDYVELDVADSGSFLYDSSLAELEKALPSTFLRVHRSYIVNSRFIRTLERDASGSGRLILTTGAEVPVSRRILPKVRKALT